eukprot:TCALIF_11605-PA protein Name:"Protein of unknown function" AED:0.58 eAED:0.58 QI:0/0.33/0.25/0.75/1/0.75/4/0/158
MTCGYLGILGDGNACALSCIPQGYTSGYCEYDQCICGVQTQPLINDLNGNDDGHFGILNPSSRNWVRRHKEKDRIDNEDSEPVWPQSQTRNDGEDWDVPAEDEGYESDNEFEDDDDDDDEDEDDDDDDDDDDSKRRHGHYFSGGRRHKGRRHSFGRRS